jgi:hypothetical protein
MDTILSSAVRFHPERGAQTGVASARRRDLRRAAHRSPGGAGAPDGAAARLPAASDQHADVWNLRQLF